MVLGLRSKSKKGASVQVDYIIHVQEIKPWPPSQSLRSLRSVALQWENGDRNSGSTSAVSPSIGSAIGEGRIEFNTSFRLQVTFLKDGSSKNNEKVLFQKNVLELHLYEPKRDKAIKGQHLGSAVIDLAEHGILKESVNVTVPVSCKRSFRNTAQPVIYIKIQPFENDSGSSSSREFPSKEVSLDRDVKEPVSALISEEYCEEAEIASFTDDDVSSQSSLINTSTDFQVQRSSGAKVHHENVSDIAKVIKGEGRVEDDLPSEPVAEKKELKLLAVEDVPIAASINESGIFPQSSLVDVPAITARFGYGNNSVSIYPHKSPALTIEKFDTPVVHSSSSSRAYSEAEETTRSHKNKTGVERDDARDKFQLKTMDSISDESALGNDVVEEKNISVAQEKIESSYCDHQKDSVGTATTAVTEVHKNKDEKAPESTKRTDEVAICQDATNSVVEGTTEAIQAENRSNSQVEEIQNHSVQNGFSVKVPPNFSSATVSSMEQPAVSQHHSNLQFSLRRTMTSDMTLPMQGVLDRNNSISTSDRIRNLKSSMRPHPDLQRSITSVNNDQLAEDVKEIDVLDDVCGGSTSSVTDDGKDGLEGISVVSERFRHVSRSSKTAVSSNRVLELEHRVKMLEGELREAAAVEVALYSIVAEHGSSAHKVHTPARRLSRLYLHASRQLSLERRASAAKSAVSGLVLAAKACGNDVPRLTFWLSNSVVLRAIVTQETGQQDLLRASNGHVPVANSARLAPKKKPSLRWDSTARKKENLLGEFDAWEDPCTFASALANIEAWIFSRIVESVWWQTLTPHMQCAKGTDKAKIHLLAKKSPRRAPILADQQQANISIEIWKNAFRDSCEKLCPLRAAGHECGCLPMLAKLVMEQCVSRLDIAMFNAILRDSDDDIPTDPVSDPISDPKVLPIPSGKSSFGAGAQLKNAIGNWSRWLTDLFGMDMDDSPQDKKEEDDERMDVAESFKSFHLLNALSDLLMLPKDMLLEKSIRKEVCPTFSASVMIRILDSFEPDEFCPDPIPDALLELLDCEDSLDSSEEEIRNFPCSASHIVYSPPSVSSVESIVGDVRSSTLLRRSRSSVVRKCHTSDDELEELDSPLTSIIVDKSSVSTPKLNGKTSSATVRYQLLREAWRDSD